MTIHVAQGVRLVMQKRALINLFTLLVLITLLVTPVYAQDETSAGDTPATAQAAPPGLGTLVLLVGIGALAIVGGRMWLRDHYKGDGLL
jgi:hypothetical protein